MVAGVAMTMIFPGFPQRLAGFTAGSMLMTGILYFSRMRITAALVAVLQAMTIALTPF